MARIMFRDPGAQDADRCGCPARFFAVEHEGRLFLTNRRDGGTYSHAALFDTGAGRVLSGVAASSEAEATERAAARLSGAALFGGSFLAVVPLREVSGAEAEALGAAYSTDPTLFLAAHRSAFRRG